jgi:PhoH-like ATPase
VLEEIDSFKKDLSDLGRNAREVSRLLDNARRLGRLSEGVPIDTGGVLRVAIGQRTLPDPLKTSQIADNYILSVALEVRDAEPTVRTFLVTKDVNLRVRGDALGLLTIDYDAEKIDIQELYSGTRELEVPGAVVDTFYQEGQAAPPGGGDAFLANEYLLLKDAQNAAHTALARWDGVQKKAVPVKKMREGVWGIRPKNKEQHYALDLLLNDDIKLVTLVGKAGTGKTLLAIAAGLQKVVEENVFIKLLVSRPIFPLGRDIGFLPGDIEDKLNPWMQPIYDNVEFLLGFDKSGKDKKEGRSYAEMMDLGYVEIEPLTYIRGRSIPNQYMIVDEAQNLTPHEVKTIITRVGDGTKIVLTGDPYQIDNPYVDSGNNGLTTVVERFKNEPIAGHVTLTRGERSALAELASNIL